MADLIASRITATTVAAGGAVRIQVFGGKPGTQWLVADFELPAADALSLAGQIGTTAPVLYESNQTVSLAAANNTSFTLDSTTGLVAGQWIGIATAGEPDAPLTIVSINTVDSATGLHVTFVSGANAANVAVGDIIVVTSQPTGSSTSLDYGEFNSPLVGVSNAI
jgi:hypothetical protein